MNVYYAVSWNFKEKQTNTEIKWMIQKMMWKMLLDTGELPVHMWDYKVIKCIYDVINWINSLRSNYLTDFHQIKTRTQRLRSNWVRINSHSVQFDSVRFRKLHWIKWNEEEQENIKLHSNGQLRLNRKLIGFFIWIGFIYRAIQPGDYITYGVEKSNGQANSI